MSTIELFREDAYLTECDATVTAADERGIQLDRTVFYPLGGGQAGDTGTLTLPDGTSVNIADTRKDRESGAILHVIAAGRPLPPVGSRVSARIDWQRRYKHMRFHTATHLLCAVVPFPTNGCSITEAYARLDFATHEAPIDKDHVQRELERLIAESHEASTVWVTDEELDARPELVRTMSVSPPRGVGRIRLLKIADVDLQACGGTHVKNTRELGAIKIAKVEKLSASSRRIRLEFA